MSLFTKYGYRLTLSILEHILKGFVEPSICKKIKCSEDAPAKINGNKYCKLNNLFKVGLSILKPPHNHFAMFSPTPGIAEAKFVITVAPQKLI
jgi:hypothetical protein